MCRMPTRGRILNARVRQTTHPTRLDEEGITSASQPRQQEALAVVLRGEPKSGCRRLRQGWSTRRYAVASRVPDLTMIPLWGTIQAPSFSSSTVRRTHYFMNWIMTPGPARVSVVHHERCHTRAISRRGAVVREKSKPHCVQRPRLPVSLRSGAVWGRPGSVRSWCGTTGGNNVGVRC